MLTFKKIQPKEKNELGKLEAKLWEIFSIFIRLRNADRDGYVICFTCGGNYHWSKVDAGHCIGGRGNAILFDEIGTQSQCETCNRFRGGNYERFKINLDKVYGEGTYQKLYIQSKQAVQFTPALLKNNIEYYTQQVKFHKERIGMI